MNMKNLIDCCSLFPILMMASSVFSADLETEFINSSSTYSQVATVTSNGAKTIYVSGQVGIRDGQIPDSFAEQIDIVFSNMQGQLTAAGATMGNVIKLTGFIVDMGKEVVSNYEFVKVNDHKSHLLMNVLNMDALCTEMTSDKAKEWDKANNCEDTVYGIELVE